MGRGGAAARRRRLGWATLTVVGAALVAGSPQLALWGGGPVVARDGVVRSRWLAPAAFVRPGRAELAPVDGRLLGVAPAGLVPGGAALARIAPAPHPPRVLPPFWAGWAGGAATPSSLPPPPGGAGILCAWRRCSSPPLPVVPPTRVTAAATGWFTPAWDPLAALSLAADSDLPPGALAVGPSPPPVGRVVAAGTVVGMLGSPREGRWLVALPAVARTALGQASGVRIGWGGHRGRAARFLTGGPALGGRFLATFAAADPGVPEPPARTEVRVVLPAAVGTLVPASAVRLVHGRAVLWRVGPGRLLRRQPVRVLGTAGGWSAVDGLAAGDRVLAHPWVLARLVAQGS